MGICGSIDSSSLYFDGTAFQSRLTQDQLSSFASHFDERSFSKGDIILNQNDPVHRVIGSDYFLVIEGQLDFHHDSAFICSKIGGQGFLDPIQESATNKGAGVTVRKPAPTESAPSSLAVANLKKPRKSGRDFQSAFTGARLSRASISQNKPLNASAESNNSQSSNDNDQTSPTNPAAHHRSARGSRFSVDYSTSARHRVATCVAKSEGRVLVLEYENLLEFLRLHPTCKNAVMPLLTDPAEFLSGLAFFKGINPRKLVALGILLNHVMLQPNEVLFEEGSLGNSLYIMLEGVVKATARTPAAQSTGGEADDSQSMVQRELKQFRRSEIFGEISLIMDIPRTASITAIDQSLVLELSRESFQRLLKMVPNTVNFHNIMKMRTAEHFRKYKVPFFEAIPDDKYSILASLCKIEQVPASTVIFKEGDTGNCFYIIAYGEVKVTVKTKDPVTNAETGERELTRLGPGKYFGEIALIAMDGDGKAVKRTATVTATARCVILSITKENFQTFFNEAPEAIADFEVKLARYDVQLRSVIYHQLGLDYFWQHLKREYSEENIEFWRACRDFRHVPAALQAEEKAAQFAREKGDGNNESFEIKQETEEIQSAMTELRDAVAAAGANNYSGQQVLNLKALYEIFKGGSADEVANYCINTQHFQDMFDILNLPLVAGDFESLLKDLNIAAGSNISLSVFNQTVGRFTDPAFIGQLLVQSQGNAGKKKRSDHSQLVSAKLMLKFEREMMNNNIANLRGAFDPVDTEHSGEIDFNEFCVVMKTLGTELSDEQLSSAFAVIDENTSGSISFAEFVAYHVFENQQAKKLHQRLTATANEIFSQFIGDSAARQVNIKGPTQLLIGQDIKSNNIHLHLFDRAEEEILKLMSSDSFARFKQSDLFQQFLDQADSYKHVDASNEDEKNKGKSATGKKFGKSAAGGAATNGFQPKLRKHSFSGKRNQVQGPIGAVAMKKAEGVELNSIDLKMDDADQSSQSPDEIKKHQEEYKAQQRAMLRGQ